jgi:hypothetical protein
VTGASNSSESFVLSRKEHLLASWLSAEDVQTFLDAGAMVTEKTTRCSMRRTRERTRLRTFLHTPRPTLLARSGKLSGSPIVWGWENDADRRCPMT